MRLDKFLADMGLGSRSALGREIRDGAATVGGETVRRPNTPVSAQDEVLWHGERIFYQEFEYYMLNKPAGVLTATEDRRQPTVLDLMIPENMADAGAGAGGGGMRRDLFPAGRLDRDTEGLLLITNDGGLAHALLAPKRHVEKVYEAWLDRPATEEDAARFEEGLRVDAALTAMPAKLELSVTEPCRVFVTLQEGKFHQVKRMFEAVGKTVVSLKRLSMGPLRLDPALLPGTFRSLSEAERDALREIARAGKKADGDA
ncbi:pseudouridine synthase [Lachnoclostridium sp. Marseille-P6806]|uniref:pseudouridine synthase n=1 Tax=Lachnoclostridium sp. Marseille-P6806 TaxID=2364793 RepID=UPI001030334F|nr:pseudouridine synthase [Lachnoclostridium sp. Marseille-P6806]